MARGPFFSVVWEKLVKPTWLKMKTQKTRIDKLTKKEEARFTEWRGRWIQIGLNTMPTSANDRAHFAMAVERCYVAASLVPPQCIVWVQSPLIMALAAPIAGWLLDREAVRGAVGGAVGEAKALCQYIKNNWSYYMGGQFWVGGWYWGSPSVVSFFREVCGLRLSDDIEERAFAYEETTRTACWWWPHGDFVIVCERPARISRDEQGRLHCETGKAIEFPDGWGISSWHGTVVPDEWITGRETLDPLIALRDPSVEKRRAAAEIIGWSRVLSQLTMRVLDKDPDPEIGELLSVDLPGAPDSRFLRVRCATGRNFVLPVPREETTALKAQVWLYQGVTVDEFLNNMEGRT